MFRFALMRLSITTLSFSSLRLRILTLPKWSLTTSDMVMLADSAKSCRACHSASENRTRSMLFRVVMIPILQDGAVLNKATPCCYTSFRTCGLVMWAFCPPEPPYFGLRPARPLALHSPPSAPRWGVRVALCRQGAGQASLRSLTPHPAVSVGHSKGIKCFRGINRYASLRYLFHGHLTPFPFKQL